MPKLTEKELNALNDSLKELNALNDSLSQIYTQDKASAEDVGATIGYLAKIVQKKHAETGQSLQQLAQNFSQELEKVRSSVKKVEKKQSGAEQELRSSLKALRSKIQSIPDVEMTVSRLVSEQMSEVPSVLEQAEATLEIIDQLTGENRIDASSVKNLEANIDASKLNLPEIKELDASKIKGLKELLPRHPPIYGGGSGATFLESLRDIYKEGVKAAENDQVLTYDSTLKKWTAKDAQGGTGSGATTSVEAASGTIDGSNTTFTTTNEPIAVSVDGMMRRDGKGVTVTGSGPYTIETDPLQPPTYDVFILYNS